MKRLNDEGGGLHFNAGESFASCPQPPVTLGLRLFRVVPTHQLARLQTTGKNLDSLFKVITECIANVCDEDLQGAASVPRLLPHDYLF